MSGAYLEIEDWLNHSHKLQDTLANPETDTLFNPLWFNREKMHPPRTMNDQFDFELMEGYVNTKQFA